MVETREPLNLAKSAMDFLSFKYSITLIATVMACLCLHSFIKATKKKRYPPLTGTVFHQILYFSTVHDYHTDLAARFKTFRLFSPTRSLIYTVDPAIVEYILRTNYTNYGKGSYNYNNLKDLLGDGIFAVDGEKWRHQRKLASYEFTTKNLRDFSSDVFRSNASRLSLIISKAANSNQAMDIQDLFMKSTLDSIFKIGFGEELDTLSGLSEEGNSFAKAFDDSSDLILWRYVDIFWKIKRFLGVGSEAELKKNIRVIDGFAYKLIYRKTQSMSKQQIDTMKKEDILSRFLVQKTKDPKNLNDQYLRDIILNFIIAGRDTTAVTLSWFFYMLCKHPSLQEKLAQEIKEATKTNDSISIAEFASRLTDEALDKMQYLHAALTETLRIYPAVPEDPKICFSDDTLPGGFDVKKGDMVCFLPYSMGRMKFLWGVDAEVFRPERWLDENGVFRPENPFKFTAFQAGPRICLGKEFAYRQMKIFAAVLIHFFTFMLSDERKDVKYKSTLTLRIDQGLHLLAYQREPMASSNDPSM
ncbi:cytochrome P450 704C1-like isoform X1 [Phoenix dactylifera]|uniref:Cytochrome P450 704C1-like isoform X1 n=1 Tax=Phoenix dactylifera TaxID=42345 RepID=A0A8B7BIC4_PHODC|nr:cytochrome P450 704C1-like isoform X1 [Phoenix dactylifera]